MRFAYLTLVIALTGCGQLAPSPLGNVVAQPPQLSPGLRDQRNRVDVHYHLNTPARVSSYIQASDGQQWPIATDAARPRPGDYVLQFDGTIAGPGPNERRVLPDGSYQLVLDVTSSTQHQQTTQPMTISGADASVPDVTDLALLPDHISPNFDAQSDVTHLTFRLAKDARVSAFLDQDGKRIWMGEQTRVFAGEQNLPWDGMANGQPVPSGQYQLGVRARDAAGNVVESSQPLVVEDSGIPEASMVSVQIGPLRIIRGDQVCLDAIVRNTGPTVLRTHGPDPGYVYNSLDSYSSIADHAYAEHAGFWRVGLNWSGSTDLNGASYPYRWGFGHDLRPGEEALVHGCVTVVNEQDQLVFAAGLIQENVAIHSSGAGLVRVQISS